MDADATAETLPADAWGAYRASLVRFVRARVGDDAAAEDIVHDVLVRAYRQRETLRSRDRFEAWLYRITRNAVVDHYRARRPTEELPEDLADGDAEPPTTARAELARCMAPLVQRLPAHYREAVTLAELARCMAPLVQRLPAHYREAVTLAEIQGLTQRETADRLGLSLSGAKTRVQRARALLRDLLLACCRVEVDGRGAPMDYVPHGSCGPSGDAVGRAEEDGAERREGGAGCGCGGADRAS